LPNAFWIRIAGNIAVVAVITGFPMTLIYLSNPGFDGTFIFIVDGKNRDLAITISIGTTLVGRTDSSSKGSYTAGIVKTIPIRTRRTRWTVRSSS